MSNKVTLKTKAGETSPTFTVELEEFELMMVLNALRNVDAGCIASLWYFQMDNLLEPDVPELPSDIVRRLMDNLGRRLYDRCGGISSDVLQFDYEGDTRHRQYILPKTIDELFRRMKEEYWSYRFE